MRIRLLPLGAAYILLSAVVMAAAANTGNNALYMVAALLLGLLVVSGTASILSLRRLEIGSVNAGELFARKPADVFIEVRNRARWEQSGVLINGRSCPPVPAGGARQVRFGAVFARRGLHPLPTLRIESRFPFGLLSWGREEGGRDPVLVYPALEAWHDPPRGRRREHGQEERASRWGEVFDHRGLRGFQDGDDPRHVHWKKTAQRGQLIAVEYDHRARGGVEIFLDTRTRDAARFERDVEAAAAACDRLLRRGEAVGLATPARRFEAATGEGQRRRLLGFLALVEPEG
jgi:uncharacterized protein (DUF58 family)